MLEEQGLIQFISERLQLNIATPPRPKKFMWKWRDLADRHDNVRKVVEIALVGKYTQLEDAYASVTKALNHSALFVNRRLILSVCSTYYVYCFNFGLKNLIHTSVFFLVY